MKLIYIDAKERFDFFSRMNNTSKDCIYITHLLSVKIISFFRGINCHLITDSGLSKPCNKKVDVLEDFIQGYDKDAISLSYSCIYKGVEVFLGSHNITEAYVWNGQRFFQKAFVEAVKKQKIPISFLEITNLPNKLQVDLEGVNAQSSLMNNKSNIAEYSGEDWSLWKNNFCLNYKNKKVFQVSILKKINYWYGLDWIGYNLFNVPRVEFSSTISKLRRKLRIRNLLIESDLIDEPYLFLPLQVSSDSQIIFNYHGDIIQSIREAKQISNDLGILLVVKPHPAESNENVLEEISSLRVNIGYKVSFDNTFDLIKNSHSVVTVNSTVGVESILLGKDVVFLGRSIYSGLTEGQIANIIMNKYVNLDYFGNEKYTL